MSAARTSLGKGPSLWSAIRAHPGRYLVGGGAALTTAALLWDVAPQLREPEAPTPPPASTESAAAPPTRVQTAASRLQVPSDRPAMTGLQDGFVRRVTKPVDTVRVLVQATAVHRPPPDQITKLLQTHGVIAVGRAVAPYVFDPQRLAVAAEREAQKQVEQAKARVARIHIDVLTCKIMPWEVVDYYRRMRRNVLEAERQAKALPADAVAAYTAAHDYFFNYKIYTYMGALGAGLAQSVVVKRMLAKPSERLLGPAFSAVATGATIPVRPFVPKAAAQMAGRAIARSVPGALVMGLTLTATGFDVRDDYRQFMDDFAKDHPQLMGTLSRELDKGLKSGSGGGQV